MLAARYAGSMLLRQPPAERMSIILLAIHAVNLNDDKRKAVHNALSLAENALLSMTPPDAARLVVNRVARGAKDAREAIVAFAKETGVSALFLGARGLSATQSLLLGSVSKYVVHHAPVPVTIVHKNKRTMPVKCLYCGNPNHYHSDPEECQKHKGAEPSKEVHRYMVCIDGSPDADAALQHALKFVGPQDHIYLFSSWEAFVQSDFSELSLVGHPRSSVAPVAVITAVPPLPGPESGNYSSPDLHARPSSSADNLFDENEKRAHALLKEAEQNVSHWAHTGRVPTVHRCLQSASPSVREAIVRFAVENDIDSIFLGSRGHSELKGLLTGSVSDYVVHHAEVPATIVRSAYTQ